MKIFGVMCVAAYLLLAQASCQVLAARRRLRHERDRMARGKHAKGGKGKGAMFSFSNSKSGSREGVDRVVPGKTSKGRHPWISSNGCDSPFGYGTTEFDRLVECFGVDNIVVAAYLSNVAFSSRLMAAVAAITHDKRYLDEHFLSSGFQFYMQAESGKCEETVPPYLCNLLKCGATHPDVVGSFVQGVTSHPGTLPTGKLLDLCRDCGVAYDGSRLNMKVGGSGSGSGMQLYCTDVKRRESTPLLTVGGGGGSGAGPGVSWGTGGGAGMQILLGEVDSNLSCTGGGCGSGRDTIDGEDRCREVRRKSDSKHHAKETGDDDDECIVRDEGCEADEFVHGINLVRKVVSECIKNPATEISVSAGGGAGGGVNDFEELLYRFSTGFSFNAGPKPVLPDSSNSGGGNTTDSELREECSYAYADAVCANANYLDNAETSFELCQCPVRNLYNPLPYSSDCSYSSSDPEPSTSPVDIDLLTENCEDWCPEEVSVTTFTGEACPVLLPACSCKT